VKEIALEDSNESYSQETVTEVIQDNEIAHSRSPNEEIIPVQPGILKNHDSLQLNQQKIEPHDIGLGPASIETESNQESSYVKGDPMITEPKVREISDSNESDVSEIIAKQDFKGTEIAQLSTKSEHISLNEAQNSRCVDVITNSMFFSL
jgi:hypothetical protein